MDQLADQMARECHEYILKSLQIMESLVSTAVGDCRDLGAEMEKFLVGPSFEEIWNSYQVEPLTPMEYLGEIFAAGTGHETNEFYEEELQGLSEKSPLTREKALLLLSYLQAGTTRVLMEINSNHKPVFEGLFQQSQEFVGFIASMTKVHGKTKEKLGLSNANAMFNRVTRRTLTSDGLRNVESFLSCSEKFHEELRETIKQVAEDASQQYNQSANLIRKNLEKNQAYLKRQQEQLEVLILQLKGTSSLEVDDWSKLYYVIQIAHKSILDTVLLLIQESPKVIRGSFELVEYAIESVCTVLRKIKLLADELGYSKSTSEKENPLQNELNLKLLKIPDECAELIFQKHLSKSFAESRTVKIVPTLEGDKLQRMILSLLGDWYQHCAPILAPIGSKTIRTEVLGIPSALVNMLPTFQSTNLLSQVKVLYGKLSVKSIPTPVTIGLCPTQMIVTGDALNASVLLVVPVSLMLSTKVINSFLGSKNGLALVTSKGEISLYFEHDADRQHLTSWTAQHCGKPQNPLFPSVLNQYCIVVSSDGQSGELDIKSEHAPLLKAREMRCKQALYWLGNPGIKSFSRKTTFALCSIYRLLPLMAGYLEGKTAHPGALVDQVIDEVSDRKNTKNEFRVGKPPSFLLSMNQSVTDFWLNFLMSPDTLFHSFTVMDNNILIDIIDIQILLATVDTLYLVMSSEQKRHEPNFFQLHQNGPDAEVWEPETEDSPKATVGKDWKSQIRRLLQPPTIDAGSSGDFSSPNKS
jgi:hypothetical protein